MSNERVYVAVYGTLKRGYHANGYLRDTVFVGVGQTVEPYLMGGHGFPIITPHPDGYPVKVEVYEVPKDKADQVMATLDRYEGYPTFYTRNLREIVVDGVGELSAMIYEGNEAKAMIPRAPVYPQDGILSWSRS